jgi:hypothetical protein
MAETDLGRRIDCSNAIMLGDSYAGDLQTPKEQLGFGLVVLREDGHTQPEIVDAHQITVSDVHDTVQFLR